MQNLFDGYCTYLVQYTVHTFTDGSFPIPLCRVHVQLLTGSGYIPHQVVARVAHVGGSGADSPSSQCDCAECWVVQLATDCCRERHHVQCTYTVYYSLVKDNTAITGMSERPPPVVVNGDFVCA